MPAQSARMRTQVAPASSKRPCQSGPRSRSKAWTPKIPSSRVWVGVAVGLGASVGVNSGVAVEVMVTEGVAVTASVDVGLPPVAVALGVPMPVAVAEGVPPGVVVAVAGSVALLPGVALGQGRRTSGEGRGMMMGICGTPWPRWRKGR